jgi:anti-anti-sigma factor
MLDAFIDGERASGATTVCIDLSSCTGMDSTFMGLLVGTNHALVQQGGRLVVVNPSPANLRLLEMLGVTQVVPVAESALQVEVEMVAVESRQGIGALQRMDLVLRAHRELIALSADNQAKFETFVRALEGDLERQREQGHHPAPGADAGPGN